MDEPEGAPGYGGGEPGEPRGRGEGRVAHASARLREEQTRALRVIGDTRARLERARPRSQFVDAAFRAVDHDVRTGGIVLAGAVAFRLFLFLVPYVFVAVVGFGIAADAANRDAGELARDAGIGGLVAKALSGAADLSGLARLTTLVVALIALAFGARALVKVLRIVFGLIWGVMPTRPHSPAKPVLFLLGLTTVLFAFAAVLGELKDQSLLLGLLGLALSAIVTFTVGLVASLYLPRQPTHWFDLIPGNVVLALGTLVLHAVTVYWIAREIESKTETYGAIGAAIALLLWSYLLGRLVTASAVVNAAVWQRRHEKAQRRASPVHASSREGSRDRTEAGT